VLTEQYNKGIISQEACNAQKEQLDYEQRVRELETQKKYADVSFAMQASQIISTGTPAAIQVFSAMAAIPIVSPAPGAVAAAPVAVTTALQVAKAGRDRVKSMTLESPGSGGGSAAKTGSIRLKPGFAEGGGNAPAEGDMSSRGYTGPGQKYEVAGWQPVHSGEYVVDTESLNYSDVVDKARAIGRVRRRHTDRHPLPEGFAGGDSNAPAGDSATHLWDMDAQTAKNLLDVLTHLAEGDIRVNYGITELETKQRDKMIAESRFFRKRISS
jgi:hypothetical protein